MAEEAYRNDLTSKLTFSVTVWALLLATLLSPIAFRSSLSAHHQKPGGRAGAGAVTDHMSREEDDTSSSLDKRERELEVVSAPRRGSYR